METTFVNLYDVLHSEKTATTEDLKRNYQNLARSYHPDKNTSQGESDEDFLLIQKAWTVLRDPVKRKQYDSELACHENSEALVYEILNLNDLDYNEDENCFKYPCRCGGTYVVYSSDLVACRIMVGCDECSFSIHIIVPESSFSSNRSSADGR